MTTISFGHHILQPGQIISLETSRLPLQVTFRGSPQEYHTILLHDANSKVHFLERDIPGNRIDLGQIVTPFIPLNDNQTYVFNIYQQSNSLPVEQLAFIVDSPSGSPTGDTPDEKYCRCVIDVKAKQPEACLTDKAWYGQREGYTCTNPYAVCHSHITGESGRPVCD